MSKTYCRGCNNNNIGTKEDVYTRGNIRETTTFYYCRDCGRELDRETTTEYISYPSDPKKDRSW